MGPRRSSAATLCSGLALLLWVAGSAAAQGDDSSRARAGALVDEGVALFQKGDAAAALDRFEQARALYPSPKIDFDIGEALRALGRTAEAAEAYDRFLEETGADSREVVNQRQTARTQLDRLERQLARIALRIDPDDPAREIRIDGLVAAVRPGRPLHLMPGRHLIEVTAPGASAVRTELVLRAGELRDVAVALGKAPVAAPPAPAPRRDLVRTAPPAHRRRVWTWVAAGGAAVLLASGALFGHRADTAYDEYKMTDSPGRYDELRDQVRRDSLTANLLFAGSGAAAIGSVILFVGEF